MLGSALWWKLGRPACWASCHDGLLGSFCEQRRSMGGPGSALERPCPRAVTVAFQNTATRCN